MHLRIALVSALLISPAMADDGARRVAAIPSLVEQRNNAMDALAFCGGDLQSLQKENASLKTELDKLKKPDDKSTEAK